MQHTESFNHGFDPLGVGDVVSSSLADDLREVLYEGVSDVVIMVAVPHYVFGSGELLVALGVVTKVTVGKAGLVEPVSRSNAASYDGFQDSGPVMVCFVFVAGVFFCRDWTWWPVYQRVG